MRFNAVSREGTDVSAVEFVSLTDYGPLMISLAGKDRTVEIEISFSLPFTYRKCDESYAMATVAALNAWWGEDYYYWFYTVDDSPLLEQFHVENDGMYRKRQIRHFMIVTDNELMDVLSELDPVVTFKKASIAWSRSDRGGKN